MIPYRFMIMNKDGLNLSADVCVIGGGVAGCAAAIQCARQGLETLLIEKGCTLGGLATNGYVPQVAGGVEGICCELIQRIDRNWPVRNMAPQGSPYYVLPVFEPEEAKLALEALVEESGARILYNVTFCEAQMKERCLKTAVFTSIGETVTVHAPMYVDATGTGDVAFSAGVPYESGSAAYEGCNMATSQGIRFSGADLERYEAAVAEWKKTNDVPLAYALEENAIQRGEFTKHITNPQNGFHYVRLPGTENNRADFVSFGLHSYYCHNTDPVDVSRQIQEQHRDMETFCRFLRKYVPGFENVRITGIGSLPGFRDGRRFECGYRLRDTDLAAGRKFPDGIARYPETFATHHPTQHEHFIVREITVPEAEGSAIEVSRTENSAVVRKNPRDWSELPYRSMIPEGVDNLVNVGRCCSSEFHASSALRVIGPAMESGLAAGIACALAQKRNKLLRELDGCEIRRMMKDFGVDLDQNAPGYGM